MQENLEKCKKNRIALCGSSTKLINQINDCLKSDEVNFIILEELSDQLNIKLNQLKEIDNKIEPLIKLDNYDAEIESVHEY